MHSRRLALAIMALAAMPLTGTPFSSFEVGRPPIPEPFNDAPSVDHHRRGRPFTKSAARAAAKRKAKRRKANKVARISRRVNRRAA